jgi:uncharacterized OB-fold protein
VIYSAAPAFTADLPFQTAIVTLDQGGRVTGRIKGERVSIGDRVNEVENQDGIPFFEKA